MPSTGSKAIALRERRNGAIGLIQPAEADASVERLDGCQSCTIRRQARALGIGIAGRRVENLHSA